MPKSATDATRFTSTTPHASTKGPIKLPFNSLPRRTAGPAGPPGESLQQKVKRLRAEADRQRDAQVPKFDKVLLRGRVWADRVHRFVTLSLIGATVIATGVTGYVVVDMLKYNRKKSAEYFAEQRAIHENNLTNARLAMAAKTATEEEVSLVFQDDAEKAAKARTASKPGVFKRLWDVTGLKKEETSESLAANEARAATDSVWEQGSGILKAIEETKSGLGDKAKQAFEAEKGNQRTGGPLDRLGTLPSTPNSNGEGPPKSKGWLSSITGR